MKTRNRKDMAKLFLPTHRANYIIGRALYETAKRIQKEEPSDYSDMVLLGEEIFAIGWGSAQMMELHTKRSVKKK